MEAVTSAIAQLGYRPNSTARALVTRRVGAVAVVVPEAEDRVFADPFFPQVYHGALEAFSGGDIQVLLVMAQPGQETSRLVRYLGSGHIDGALVVSHHGPELAMTLRGGPLPVVFIGHPRIPGLHYVELDQYTAAVTATRHLIERGCHRIATITGPLDMAAGVERLRGFRSALADAGLTPIGQEAGDFTSLGGAAAAERLLAAHPDLDAVFAASDLMAVGLMRVLSRTGRRVPEDVRVIGFDDSIAALSTEPQLTTMTNPASEMARIAGGMLLDLLSGTDVGDSVILHSELVLRGSS
jgi:DNA-binding LacI/PurR family transcriptional regulator